MTALESSVASIEETLSIPGVGVEIDIRFTKNEVPIILHDASLRRTARSKPGKFCDLDANVKKLNWKSINSNCELLNGEPIPALNRLLGRLVESGRTVLFDLKANPNRKFRKMVRGHFESSEKNVVFLVRKSKHARLLRRVSSVDSFFRKTTKLFLIKGDLPEKVPVLDGWDAEYVDKKSLIYHKEMEQVVGVYTVNSITEMAHLVDMGVDYITTDRPRECASLLQ